MKTRKKLILLLCALVLVTGGYFCIRRPEGKAPLRESAGVFDLTDRTLDDMTGISWTTEGKTRTFTLQDGQWKAAEDSAEFSEDTDAAGTLAEQVVNLQATRRIENVENLEEYGLTEPVVVVTAEWKNGSTVYSMGVPTPFRDGYYLCLSGDRQTIYTIAFPLAAFGTAENR